ncbi:hypothetical protein NLU13_1442 [Sarocladium strictum]|uniref:HMG box domain-containing protein n=1 Tax=Sarocladium strictum TaxID=5046 RepID=A0AA39GT00_SARSR|nr:hypothetical protein NLU13_1442 [Sarocladium strictum]
MARTKKADADKAKLPGMPQPLAAPPQVMMPQQHMQMPTMVPQHHLQQPMGVPQPPMQHQPQLQQVQQQQPIAQGMQRVVDAEQFMRVRDSCLTRFATITGLIREFAHDYARQTNLLMGVGDHAGDDPHSSALLAQLDNASSQLMLNGLTDLVPAGGEEKKERKKRVHDQNAPKRPLTPYFLYMQHARSVIAGDLGEDAPKGAVQTEGQRRWSQMSEGEKLGWNTAYQYNLRLYNARVHSYKIGGNPLAKDMTDEEALDYANAHNIPVPPLKDTAATGDSNDQAAIAEQLGADDSSKTPKKNAAQRKRKSDAPADMNPAVPSPAASRGKKAKN